MTDIDLERIIADRLASVENRAGVIRELMADNQRLHGELSEAKARLDYRHVLLTCVIDYLRRTDQINNDAAPALLADLKRELSR